MEWSVVLCSVCVCVCPEKTGFLGGARPRPRYGDHKTHKVFVQNEAKKPQQPPFTPNLFPSPPRASV
uniref:Putative secreted protein n=1 Tax=Anopheles marajoara TaxID=58244 RepID=A0A2M4CFM2_9DIPT